MPRILGAIVAAVALHSAALLLRPGASGASYTPAAPVLAVRMLRTSAVVPAKSHTAAAPATASAAEPEPPPVREPRVTEALAERPSKAASASTEARSASAELPSAVPPDVRVEAAAATARSLPEAPDYALGARLDPGPRPLGEILPDYPANGNRRSGTVVLRLLISDSGAVDSVDVVRAEPAGVFERSAIDAFAKARFSPGLAAGTPVKSQITVEVQFLPINRGAGISGRSY